MINSRFLIIGALLQLVGSASYLAGTIKGKVRPNRVSWLLWAVIGFIGAAAELSQGAGLLAVVVFMAGFGPLLVLIGSFFNPASVWKLTKLDVFCGALSIFGLVLWRLTSDANLAIIFTILADGFAWLPTAVKSYANPESENWLFFLFDAISAGLTLLAVRKWQFIYYGYPMYLLATCLILVALITTKLGAQRKPPVAEMVRAEDDRPI